MSYVCPGERSYNNDRDVMAVTGVAPPPAPEIKVSEAKSAAGVHWQASVCKLSFAGVQAGKAASFAPGASVVVEWQLPHWPQADTLEIVNKTKPFLPAGTPAAPAKQPEKMPVVVIKGEPRGSVNITVPATPGSYELRYALGLQPEPAVAIVSMPFEVRKAF